MQRVYESLIGREQFAPLLLSQDYIEAEDRARRSFVAQLANERHGEVNQTVFAANLFLDRF